MASIFECAEAQEIVYIRHEVCSMSVFTFKRKLTLAHGMGTRKVMSIFLNPYMLKNGAYFFSCQLKTLSLISTSLPCANPPDPLARLFHR